MINLSQDDPPDNRLSVAEAGSKGLGVFASVRFSVGDHVLWFSGPRMLAAGVSDFSHVIRLDINSFIGPSGGIDDLVNHSCDPNAGIRAVGGQLELFSLCDIMPDEEITFDYSTCMLDEPPLSWCACGAPSCRHAIVPFPALPDSLRLRDARKLALPDYCFAWVQNEHPAMW